MEFEFLIYQNLNRYHAGIKQRRLTNLLQVDNPHNNRLGHHLDIHQSSGRFIRKLSLLHHPLWQPVEATHLLPHLRRSPYRNPISTHNVLHHALNSTSQLTQEKNISTVITFCDFFITNAIVQIAYSLLWIVFYAWSSDQSTESVVNMKSCGLWVMWMVYIVRICQSDPTGNIQLCCFPVNIPKRFYPLVILLALGIFQFKIPYDILVAYLLGLVQCTFFDGSFVKLSNSAYRRIQMSFLLRWMTLRDDFCPLDISPKAKHFCSDSHQRDYKAFYSHFMGRNVAGEDMNNQQQLPSSSAVPNFSNAGVGISLGDKIKTVVTMDDVRSHWASK